MTMRHMVAACAVLACGHAVSSSRASNGANPPTQTVVNKDAYHRRDEPIVEPHDPIDGRVVGVVNDGDQMIRVLIVTGHADDHDIVTRKWIGVFTDRGKVIEGTNFKIRSIRGTGVETRIAGPKPPSTTVRLYPPERAPRSLLNE